MSDQATRNDKSDIVTSYDRLLNTVDLYIGQIDKYETELAA